MGRTREKNASRIKVNLYIAKRGLCKAGKVPRGFCGKSGERGADEDEDGTRPFDSENVIETWAAFILEGPYMM
jgi:hypothetical protein